MTSPTIDRTPARSPWCSSWRAASRLCSSKACISLPSCMGVSSGSASLKASELTPSSRVVATGSGFWKEFTTLTSAKRPPLSNSARSESVNCLSSSGAISLPMRLCKCTISRRLNLEKSPCSGMAVETRKAPPNMIALKFKIPFFGE